MIVWLTYKENLFQLDGALWKYIIFDVLWQVNIFIETWTILEWP